MIVEHHVFTLAEGVDDEVFLAADNRVQQEFSPHQPGFVRRTTCRGDGGRWLVETYWDTVTDAVAAMSSSHEAVTALFACIDKDHEDVARWETLD